MVAAVVVAIAAAGRLHLSLSDTASANNATGGRVDLVKGGIDLFGDRPVWGFGSGSFSCEFLRHMHRRAARCGAPPAPGVTSDSHTAPITVAAEQGVDRAARLRRSAGRRDRRAGGRRRLRRSAARVAILAAFVALVVHTWAYADFLEDPITWALLAVGTVLARE